jgi:hypothetical protein
VPKLDQQPIMIHFRSASGLCLPLQEHKPGSFAAKIPLHETSLFRDVISLQESRFSKIKSRYALSGANSAHENLIPNGNLYFIDKALRPG